MKAAQEWKCEEAFSGGLVRVMVILGELVTCSLTLSRWVLRPAVLTSAHTVCVTAEWWRRKTSWEMRQDHIRRARAVNVSGAVGLHLNCCSSSIFPEMSPRCVFPVLRSSYAVCRITPLACSGPPPRRGSCGLRAIFLSVQARSHVYNANLLQPCKYHTVGEKGVSQHARWRD